MSCAKVQVSVQSGTGQIDGLTYLESNPTLGFSLPDLSHAIELMEFRVLGTLGDLNDLILDTSLLALPDRAHTSNT